MNKVLVTGAKGQLGMSIQSISKEYNFDFYFKDSKSLDITDYDNFNKFVEKNNIKIIINCAAYTAVDLAESNKESANSINHLALQNIAKIAKRLDIKIVHISTDYVFDGNSKVPYLESSKISPISIYGQTKLDGELALQTINPLNSIIIRTSWVYSIFGKNFMKTMIKLGAKNNSLNIISDQIGSPTNALDLARVILEILPKIKNSNIEIYNYSSEGVCSWFDFANSIFEYTNKEIIVNPIKTLQYFTPAQRPLYSVLNKEKIKNEFALQIPHWKESLKETLLNLSKND